MLFSSTVFIYLFLPITIWLYYTVFKKSRVLQNVFLLLVSLFFYAWGEPKFVLIMILSIFINWLLGLLIDKYRKSKKLSNLIIGIDVFANLSLLFVFKYLTFTASIFESIFGIDTGIPNIALPIGISFFTFQAMSYVIDVYREKGMAQKNILYVGLYISFFPQLIAGPIVRYETVAEEIQNRKETLDDFFDGFARFVVGLGKKVLLANSFALMADNAFAAENLSVAYSWFGIIAYTLQIFFDFGGYSDMAIGLGRMFGFHFLENFDYPYISKSITEFWRRWHMSLGTWFRDYVYFPLGGSRVKKPRLIFNLFVVWSLTGIWHGANFTFVLWGLMYFFLIAFEKLTGFDKKEGKILNIFKHIYTLLFVVLGWVLFRADSITDAIGYMSSMFGFNKTSFVDNLFIGNINQSFIVLGVGILLSTPIMRLIDNKFSTKKSYAFFKAIVLFVIFILSVANLISNSYNPFIYFNF